jgi:hypothetical protein
MDSVARQNSVLPGTIDDSTQGLDSRRPDASSSQPCQRPARPCALDATSRSRTWPFAGNLPPSPIDDIRPFGPLTGSFGSCYAASGVAATIVRWHRAGFRRNSFQGRRHKRPPPFARGPHPHSKDGVRGRGGRLAFTGNCCVSASVSPSAASRATYASCLARPDRARN